MSATATTEKKYLKWHQKLAYGSGDLASNCSYGLVSSFVLLYLTGTLGLDSAIIGSLMLASKVLDGISENNTRVWNAKAYLLAALFNAPSSTDNHYTMLVNHDFHHDYGG